MDSLDWAVWRNLGGWSPLPPKPDKGMKSTPWTDDIKFVPRLLVDASTWQPPVLDIGAGLKPGPVTDPGVTYGDWGYHLIAIPRHTALDTALGRERGVAWFDADTFVPAVWEQEPREVWMSFTPQELFTCRPGIRAATRNVVVGGLGLGHMLDRIASKPSVERLIVVERSRELLDWFGERLVGQIAARTGRLIEIVCDDVFAYAARFPRENQDRWRWSLDIWQGYGGAWSDERVAKMRREGWKVWAWGESAYRTDSRF